MGNEMIRIGTTQIMWKEILIIWGILFVTIYVVMKIMFRYVIKKYKKIISIYNKTESTELMPEVIKLLRISKILSYGPKNNPMSFVYNGLCWILASISLIDGNEKDFLFHLENMKDDDNFRLKYFALALYHRSKEQEQLAWLHYKKFLKCKSRYDDNGEAMYVIMKNLFENEKEDMFHDAVHSFSNPAMTILFERNDIISRIKTKMEL